MATLAEPILNAIRYAPMDDDVLSKRLGVGHRQAVNQAARRLDAEGHPQRLIGPDGKIVNALPDMPLQKTHEPTQVLQTPEPAPLGVAPGGIGESRITEDEVKEAVRGHLTAQGFDVAVAWGRVRGIDIDARHADGRRYVIEAKAEVGKNGPQQVNYFLGMLGELRTMRPWRAAPNGRPSGALRIGLDAGLPFLLSWLCAAVVLVGPPRLVKAPLFAIQMGLPDLGYLLVGSAVVALAWSRIRVVWATRVLLDRSSSAASNDSVEGGRTLPEPPHSSRPSPTTL